VEEVKTWFTNRTHMMWYGSRLRELLRQSWDLVHCWEEPFIVAGGQVAWSAPGNTPLVFYTFQNIQKSYPPPFCWIEGYCLDRCSGWLAGGRLVSQTLLARGYAKKPHKVMPLGVDLDRFFPSPGAGSEVRRQLSWDASAPVVGYLGRFVPQKGLHLLTEVLDRLRTPWRALLVGGGPLEKKLRDWGARHGDRVRIVTGVSHSDVPAYLNAMDVLCAPSQTTAGWREQFGRMLIEALACGVPVVASDSGEIPYVLADTGIVLPENDVTRWVEALAGLLADPQARALLSARGIDRAREVYAWPVIAQQHIDFFEELIG
jgi:glycosyltransferase involved in cell wall biosynthesis